MRGKKLLVAFLLGVGLCFIPVLGYGEVSKELYKIKADYMDVVLLRAMVRYMMRCPGTFMVVSISYDPDGRFTGRFLPESIDTKGKIFVVIVDSRYRFSGKSGIDLLDQFKTELEAVYYDISFVATDIDADIVAIFDSRRDIHLGYFYQGEYHLWKK